MCGWDLTLGTVDLSPVQLLLLVLPLLSPAYAAAPGKLKHTPLAQLGDERLEHEARQCISADYVCSPLVDRVRNAVG